nr:PREDICTED: cell division cycle protein 20 homolog [Bemisia tabaci]
MAQFSFLNDLNSAVRMDEPITKGPVPRWQKKTLEPSGGINSSLNLSKGKISASFNASSSGMPKTPKQSDAMAMKKTPSKTPKKSPGKTPSRTPTRTPSGGDRFIPSRTGTNFELGHYKLNQQENEREDDGLSPAQKDNRQAMKETLHGCDISQTRILAFQKKAPAPPEGYVNPLKVLYSQSKTPMSAKATSRYIPHAPDRILDAPEIVDDYYLNLIDWSSTNILAVALGNSVYLWNAATGNIDQLLELEGQDYVSSLNWIQEGNLLAVGTSLGCVQLWDATQNKRLRLMDGHAQRVASLSWNTFILSSGSRTGQIIHHDVRQREHQVALLSSHTQEVCGLKWSPDGKYLASGGNDNMLYIWSGIPGQASYQTTPLYSLSAHQAAVKALAWCPWAPHILASGGGTADRHIRFWNCNIGSCFNSIDTKSQVCGILWSSAFKEIISGHGFANNQLIIWKYPSMAKVAELTGHTARVLHLAMSPDNTTVLSAGADETLRLWKCFVPDPLKKKEVKDSAPIHSILKQSIR